ncbi:GAF domain-containing protein [Desulfobacterales bacterium HSG16]|nr:GAF domain-containing protein [Desulfobacterales bacterium HSG16]
MNKKKSAGYPFRCVLSFRPFINYLKQIEKNSESTSFTAEILEEIIEQAPELLEPVEDMAVLDACQESILKLMSLMFPPVVQENEMICAALPSTFQQVFITPSFQQIFLKEGACFQCQHDMPEEHMDQARIIEAYLIIMEKCFQIECGCDYPVVYDVLDPETGLDRYFKMECDFRFMDVHPLKSLPDYSEAMIKDIRENYTEPEVLAKYINPDNFELHGFTIYRPVDITQSQVLMAIEHDLTDHYSAISEKGFLRLRQRLRTYFRIPDLMVNLTAIQKDKVLLLNSGTEMTHQCIFADSRHINISRFAGTLYEKVVKEGKILRIFDIRKENIDQNTADIMFDPETRSLLLAPLEDQGKPIGILYIGSPRVGELCPLSELLMTRIQPLFTLAIRRALEELDNRIERVIKNQFTAIHPVVEWRFHDSVLDYLEKLRTGDVADFAPIIFRNVFPIYGGSDIRGSTNQRNEATKKDLAEHLNLALDVIRGAGKARDLPFFGELEGCIRMHLDRISGSITTADEASIIQFLLKEVESVFKHLKKFGTDVTSAIDVYESAIDSNVKTVYRLRKSFEDSVFQLNERLASYLDNEDAVAQKLFPHYFERHRTDGVDYLIYIGDSLVEGGGYNNIYLKNLRLWQLQVSCGLAWHTEQLKSSLTVPLDTAHLILIQNSPLSLRFRFDEKRFGVDGAYDIQHEIIKSRIDKAVVKDRNERLTQPGKIAVVYTHPEEAKEMMRHIEYLRSEKWLTDEIESFDLEPLPGVHGLKAIRAGINLESKALSERAEGVMV